MRLLISIALVGALAAGAFPASGTPAGPCEDGVPLLLNEFVVGAAPPAARYRAEGPTTHVLVRPIHAPLLGPNGDMFALVEFNRGGLCQTRCPDTLIPLTCPVHGLHPVFIGVRGDGAYKVCMTDDVAAGCAG